MVKVSRSEEGTKLSLVTFLFIEIKLCIEDSFFSFETLCSVEMCSS